MRKNLFLMAIVALLIAGCSKDEDGKLSLSTNKVSLMSDESQQVTANKSVEWNSDSEFVANVSEGGVITGNHIGKTIVRANSADGEALCEVEITARYKTFLEPVLEFGASKSTIKSKERRTLAADNADGIEYRGENNAVKAVAYIFKNGQMAA